MTRHSKTLRLPLIIFSLSACLFLAFQAGANRPGAQPKQVTVASVDLERLFNDLKERGAEDVRLQALALEREAEGEAMNAEINQMSAALADIPPNSDRYEEAERALVKRTIEYRSWNEFTRAELDRESAIVLRKIYASVKNEIKALAEEFHYDIVVLNDSIKPVAPNTTENVTRDISARRFFYINPAIDITDEIVVRMNNSFGAPD